MDFSLTVAQVKKMYGIRSFVYPQNSRYTPGSTNIAGWKMDPDWRCISFKKWGYSIAMLVCQRVRSWILWNQLSNEKKAPGRLACLRGENLPFVIGFIISHYRNPYETAGNSWRVIRVFFRGSIENLDIVSWMTRTHTPLFCWSHDLPAWNLT